MGSSIAAGTADRDFVVVANRLPVDRVVRPDGEVEWRRSPGGLVTALEPIMQSRDGAWIGWSGDVDHAPEPFESDGMLLHAVPLSSKEVARYYEGFSNATLWPLYHDAVAPPEFHRSWWDTYVTVNRRFAEAAAAVAGQNAVVWIQDYQLQLVPAMLRAQRPDLRIGFFLHIPFPPTELFMQLPWRTRIVEGLLGADLIGFQLPGGAANFLRLARQLCGLQPHGRTVEVTDADGEPRVVRAEAFPISIDTKGMSDLSASPEVVQRAKELYSELGEPKHVLLGVDRLDYTKGISTRLQAYRELLEDSSITVPDTVLIQVATPSRERVEHYKALRNRIELQVGRINGDFGTLGHPAVQYLHQSYGRDELCALYRVADVMLVTPLRDGMNLVAKEYVAARTDHGGALVLSEFTGAAAELRQAYQVNPHDITHLKETIVAALNQDPAEGARRMRAMRRHVTSHDVNHWAASFLDSLRKTNA
ncbi:trehalose-6-phosphate synthase [Fodinicola feengrottensis]|uniref:alpha,alpha-trehalose-phosphate synthase (ADP-forming) n=1 Tax=Fodinicola feengrottensis TaxID=435914 RepID=A0ABN2I9T6_9ACTN